MRAGAPHRDFGLREQLPRFENYQNVKMWESRKSSSTPIQLLISRVSRAVLFSEHARRAGSYLAGL